MLAHRFSLLHGVQGGECGGWKRLAIRAEQTNVVGSEKVQHRLTDVSGGSPEGGCLADADAIRGMVCGGLCGPGSQPPIWVETEFDRLLIGTPDPETVLSHLKPLARD